MKKLLLGAMALMSIYANAQLAAESFETAWTGSPAVPPGWTVVNQAGQYFTWSQAVGNVVAPAYSGNYAAYLNKENVASTDAIPQDWLISPAFTVQTNSILQFYSRLTIAGDQGGIYKVFIGSDPADLSSFTEIYSATELQINPIQTDYVQKSIDIPSTYEGQQLHIAFVMTGDNADRWFIDDVSVYKLCTAPLGFSGYSSIEHSITINWYDTNAASYEYEFVQESGAPSGTPTGMVTSPNVTLNDIANGNYKIYVRALCADGGKSVWTGPYAVTVGYNVVHGVVRYDANADGVCNAEDPVLADLNMAVNIDGQYVYNSITDENGKYDLMEIPDGVHTITLNMASTIQFPEPWVYTQDVEFTPTQREIFIEHCLSQPEAPDDMLISVNTYGNPRPGLDMWYDIYIQNSANEAKTGISATFMFDASRMDFVSSTLPVTVSGNTISIPVGDVAAYTSLAASIKFHIKEPPVNELGDEVVFTATLLGSDNDADPANNFDVYHDIMANSYDPNDITVHEGAEIYEEQADDYLTYTIRFQNTGTADAIDIKLTNTLDELLDWETFKPVVSSHNYTVKRTDDLLEFEYKNIHLADNTSNEAASHGYITYKIKPKAGFGVGDIVSNTAQIYFDFNEAIVTNTATTTVVALAGLTDNNLALARLYPNPVKGELHVEVAQGDLQSVTIYDVNGRLCLSANAGVIDTNALKSGIYFVKVTTDAGSANYKIIKQ